jgi:hypothetical protein
MFYCHMFLFLFLTICFYSSSGTVYSLPDDLEVRDSTLNDIRHQLDPRFDAQEVVQLDQLKTYSRYQVLRMFASPVSDRPPTQRPRWLRVSARFARSQQYQRERLAQCLAAIAASCAPAARLLSAT